MIAASDPRYPIGRFRAPDTIDDAAREAAIVDIDALPRRLREAVAGLSDAQLETAYREGGWTVRQVVHHVADSHLNGFIRMKLALTEQAPTIKPYDENAWATLGDMRLPIDVSLALLDGLHRRWVAVYRALTPQQFQRTFVHPELGETQTVDRHLQLYSWHSRHHVAHITALRERQGW